MALLDILDCTMDDLIEPISAASSAPKPKKVAAGGTSVSGSVSWLLDGPHQRSRPVTGLAEEVIADPVGLIVRLVGNVDRHLADRIRDIVCTVVRGR
ncbi:hypothetical protein E4N62_13330, partial [Streptomyces sp. MNU76]|nr:hypothetical protein [Streptomyces sp. MNU76]